jgi:hypothetical protein
VTSVQATVRDDGSVERNRALMNPRWNRRSEPLFEPSSENIRPNLR